MTNPCVVGPTAFFVNTILYRQILHGSLTIKHCAGLVNFTTLFLFKILVIEGDEHHEQQELKLWTFGRERTILDGPSQGVIC
jgi:hypothetical protein